MKLSRESANVPCDHNRLCVQGYLKLGFYLLFNNFFFSPKNHIRPRKEGINLLVGLRLKPWKFSQFISVAQLCLTLCDPMDCSTPGLPVHHQLAEFTQTHVHRVGDAIQPSHPLLSPYHTAFNLSQHQGLFKWVSFVHQVAKVLEFQLQRQSFQWIFRTDFL